MRFFTAVILSVALSSSCFAGLTDDEIILRGDANQSGALDQGDVTTITNWLFNGGAEPPCLNQADANNDGSVSLADATYLTNYLYKGGPAPPNPGAGPTCAKDDAPYPGCASGAC